MDIKLFFCKRTKILLVDDEFFNILNLKYILKNCSNVEIDHSLSGEECLNKVKTSLLEDDPYNIIFMDINMP